MVARKLSWPQGSSLMGAATGFGADGCAPYTAGASAATRARSCFTILELLLSIYFQRRTFILIDCNVAQESNTPRWTNGSY